jgi:surfeit locus 1 family protein
MIRQLPVIPTILVVAAAATMVWLGFWQLGRAEEKGALIAQYEAATKNTEEVDFPFEGDGEALWFRRSSVFCRGVEQVTPVSGTAANGAKGWTIRVVCRTNVPDTFATVDLGFTQTLGDEDWTKVLGTGEGIIAPGPRLVADPPLEGLYPLAKPDPSDLPNNHLSYAGQWFFFALTALVIYFFAVRSRLAKRD